MYQATRMPVPLAPRRTTVHEAHGVRREDDYAWLRAMDDPEALGYLKAERVYYDRAVAHLQALRGGLVDELTSRTPGAESSVAWRRGGRLYFTQTGEGEEYERLFRVDPVSGREDLLLDPQELATGSAYFELGLIEPSPDGRLLAYSLDRTGDEVYELRFRNLETGADLPDRIERSYYGGAWSADSSTFFYTVQDEVYRPDRVFRHRIGTPADTDPLVLQELDRRFELTVHASRDGGWVVLSSASRDTTEVHLVSAADPQDPPRLVAGRRRGVEYVVEPMPGGWDGKGQDLLLLVTDDGAPEFRLMWTGVPAPGGRGDHQDWRPVARAVASDASERLESACVLARHIVLSLRRDSEPFLRVLGRGPGTADGDRTAREVHPGLPCGQVRLWHPEDPAAATVVVVEENLVTAPRWVEIDLASGERRVLKRRETPGVDPTRYVTERLVATAPDGEQVPVTLARPRELEPGQARGCLLYGYGAYESCSWPEFSPVTLALLDRGVCYAVAHVRGGGELGRRWWRDGHLRSKQNTFTDFVAARDAVVAAGWAAPDGVVSRGLSAGGLLQGAVFSQAPERWRAVVAEAPFVDVVTSMSDPAIPLTVGEWDEWGDPVRDGDDFAAMLAYSPYDNPPPPGKRPALLVTGSLNDPRVLVHEPAKWVARLRATDDVGAPAPLLLRTELGQGAHTGPSGRYAALGYEAEIIAWVLDQLGLA